MKRSFKLFLKTLLIVVLIYTSGSLSAQTPDKFSSDSVAFFDEMEDYLSNARKEGKDFMKQFEVVWYGGYFSDKQRQGVYAVSNRMLKKKLRAFPDFRNYLYTVGSFVVDSNQTDESFEAWQGILIELLEDRKTRKFTQFLDFCNGLFRENVMYSSASTIWSANNSNYTFAYDSLPKITFDQLNLICFAKRDSMIIYNTKGAY
jgi:methionine salvage enolase-phosphatase E1